MYISLGFLRLFHFGLLFPFRLFLFRLLIATAVFFSFYALLLFLFFFFKYYSFIIFYVRESPFTLSYRPFHIVKSNLVHINRQSSRFSVVISNSVVISCEVLFLYSSLPLASLCQDANNRARTCSSISRYVSIIFSISSSCILFFF